MLRCLLAVALAAVANASNSPINPSSTTNQAWQKWGPYRPNLYFGVRPQVPETFLMGLMWASGESQSRMLSTLRDTCEQDDGMEGYGWTVYDTRMGGSQSFHDTELQVNVITDFLKSKDGSNWAARIVGTPKPGSSNVKTTVILHAAIERADADDSKHLVCEGRGESGSGVHATCQGDIPALDTFEIRVLGDAKNKMLHDTAVKSVQVPEEKIWQAKAVFIDQVKASSDDHIMAEDAPGAGNMHFVQLAFEGPFEVTFSYHAKGVPLIDGSAVEAGINSLHSSFSRTLGAVFPRAPPFREEAYGNLSGEIFSNLLGGLGFFHGDAKVDYSNATEYQETDLDFWTKAASAMSRAEITAAPPKALLSYTPSRPFFPRGFLWDEGFHLLPVIEWDLDLAVSVLQSWLNLMDDDGWVGREQILGPEARSRVPSEFQVQYPHYANPPTLELLVPIIISKLDGSSSYNGHHSTYISNPSEGSAMLKYLYPLLTRHYDWFRRTQTGNFTAYPRPLSAKPDTGFRWRGRTPKHTLTSGLDDYPRANPPHPGELHVDALVWVGASALALHQLAKHLGDAGSAEIYASNVRDVKQNLDALHWNSTRKTYCDSTIEDGKYTHICHEGYLSIFPLLLGLMDADHPNLPALLHLISDPEKLWSPHGLRSLSKKDEGYGKDEDYWRGAVWVNLNVLAVIRLRELGLSTAAQPAVRRKATKLAAELRERLVETVYMSWKKTGFFWEQYSDVTGEGRRSRAFTGWTATIILLMGLEFPGGLGQVPETVPGVAWSLFGMVAFPIVVVIVVPGLRRRLISATAGVVKYLLVWNAGRKRGADYEEVIDLDELHES